MRSMREFTCLSAHWNRWVLRILQFVIISILCFPVVLSFAQEDKHIDEKGLEEFLQLEPGELKRIPVYDVSITTASKRPQKLWETAAAAYVISSTEIRRSAAATIPDLLRMVPGLFVGNADSSTWIIGSRGLAAEYALELLVLIDGRQVNDLAWGGMYWNIQDYPLEDIERIEIIRGPGGTLWGTNSGNGVINIITKHAKDTQGGLLSAVAGTDLYKSVFRYGGKMGDDAYYRIYGAYKDVDSFKTTIGNESVDDWSLGNAGFRIDWTPSEQDEFTFQGNAYQDDVWFTWFGPELVLPDFFPIKDRYEKDKKGIDFQVQWNRTLEDGSKIKWQAYYDYFILDNDFASEFNYHDFKTDVQYLFTPFSNHEFIVGSGYQLIVEDIDDRLMVYNRDHANNQIGSAFIQDNYTILEDLLKLSLGVQIQYSDYSEFDYQPSAKLVYTPTENYTFWASITRAAQHYFRIHNESEWIMYSLYAPYQNGMIPMLLQLMYSDRLKSESILSFELGQRLQATNNLSFDLSVFYTMLDDHITADVDFNNPTFNLDPIPHYLVDVHGGNNIRGETYGAELAMTAQITDFWKLMASYSALDIQLHHKNNSNDFFFYSLEDGSPHHQIKLQSYLNISKNVKLDAFYYFIDEISLWAVPSHGRLDLRLDWEPNDRWEVSIVGTNLLDNQTHEANGMYTRYTEVERGVYGKVTYRF